MNALVGHEAAVVAFTKALDGGALHHAWLLTGPEGVGKGLFARAAALRMLAEAAAPGTLGPGLDVPADHRTAALIAAGSHPDYRELRRLPKDPEKPDQDIARSVSIAQVRALQPMLATKPSMSARRVIVIDAIDDLERAAANALLKNLEEPPAGTIFLLVSHRPGRLLPTIRSRCRVLRFDPLGDEAVADVLRHVMPDLPEREVAALAAAGAGSPGRALRFAGLDIAGLDAELAGILADGDPDNRRRNRLAKALGPKSAQPRYEAFLDRVPGLIAARAPLLEGAALRTALDAYAAARELARTALANSLDAGGTVFEMAGIVARLARR